MPKGIKKDQSKQRGQGNPNWKGDNVRKEQGRSRARKLYDLGICEQCGVPASDRHHKDGNTLNNTRSNIAMLCRRCHMKVDGRLDSFKKMASGKKGKAMKEPRVCVVCSGLAKIMRNGRCPRCADYLWRTGIERPMNCRRGIRPRSEVTPCPVCTRLTRLKTKGRCVVCYNYWKLNGRDRERAIFRKASLSESERNHSRIH